ncbi:SIR2 family protein [Bradyrhizobium xenonodulans]|uniref:NAD(+) hydrolase ThsA n=1 Tax=Bradyrhizobium xenonodulans TaxID=2736875 RepID=A0ABY7MIE7_9BRAD|nr:SIR2 family protein [Bradyrhizobium xenonodulans]WBL78139.1 SIR2 family protein [Bradyrhizobium xenonodulans]
MALSQEVLDFCAQFATELREDGVAIFAGAGLSASAGFVDWRGLLAKFAKELGLDVDREGDHLVRLAQYSYNHRGNRGHLDAAIIKSFPVMKAPSVNHEVLARLPISTYWTTNYDRLIETALVNAKKCVDVKHTDNQLPQSTPGRDAILYKMHGDAGQPAEAVLTRNDYENYPTKRPGFLNALSGDMTGKTFLFLGFSFTDPNLDHVLSQLRLRYHDSMRPHYCLMRTPKKTDFSSLKEHAYALARQKHFISDLKRFGIKVLLVKEYGDVTEVLRTIERLYRRRAVFVSGSAAEFLPWGEASSKAFFRNLGATLIDHDFRIVTGLGLGVGDALLSGAIERIHDRGHTRLDPFIDIRPFPRDFSDAAKRQKVWRAYREDMISRVGIAIFLFGNKLSAGVLEKSSGMREEFDIALAQGVLPLPVGTTGYLSRDLAYSVLNAKPGRFTKTNLMCVKKLNSITSGGLPALQSKIVASLEKIAAE